MGITMLDDFFVRAIIAGLGLAAITGPLGCFVVWRRMAYFGDTLAHASLLGVALGLLLQVNVSIAVFVTAIAIALAMLALQKRNVLASDAILGLLSHGALAAGLLALSFMTWLRIDLMSLLFGDLLAVAKFDIALIYGGGGLVLALLVYFWRPLFAVTVNRELASAEGMDAKKYDILLMVMLAAVVAVAIKIVGVLLITAMLIIPAAAARRVSSGPVQMAIVSLLIGMVAVIAGLFASLQWDTPSGPSIVMAAVLLFIFGLVIPTAMLRSKETADAP